MILSFIQDLISSADVDWMEAISEIYQKAGPILSPLIWIFFPWAESLLSPLPLTLIVGLNISTAKNMFGPIGYLIGFFCSYLGELLGAITVFCLYRYVVKPLIIKGIIKRKKVKKEEEKINPASGAAGLFVVSMIPYVPTAAINLVYGLSSIKTSTFIYCSIIAKFFMVFLISFCSPVIELMMSNLVYMAMGIVVSILLLFIVKKYEKNIDALISKVISKFEKRKS